ncbi:MAG: hypothetical protein WCO86_11570 [Planctomycetota bacterium]
MGGVSVEGRDGEFIKTVAEMLVRFTGDVFPKLGEWEGRLKADPQNLDALEQEVQQEFARGAGLVVAGLISVVMQTPEFCAVAEKTRQEYSVPLSNGRERKMSIQLLGGVKMWITSLYCEPRRRWGRDAGLTVSGLHIEQSQFGIAKKVSPGLETVVSRQSALCPSFELARDELNRRGLALDLKAVRRISQQCGEKLLKLRTGDLTQWRAGTLASTDELAGKRVTVQIDGGRTKLRGPLRKSAARQETRNEDGLIISDAPGRSKSRPEQTFDAEWREPKLMTIFIHNDRGRIEKKTKMTIDGTFAGPDAMAELVAMHLHQLGAAKAVSLTFVSDGAVWIWDRIDQIVACAGIPKQVAIHLVLDTCHAVHHVSLALATLGVTVEQRMPMYRDLRSRLRNGEWKYVVNELQMFANDDPGNASLATELSYLRRHGEAGRLDYADFRQRGLPLGSGAIESGIRRVINLRLKGNGIFWLEHHAEEMLQLRALVISDRWDRQVERMRSRTKQEHLADWHWTPQNMSGKIEPQPTAGKNTA